MQRTIASLFILAGGFVVTGGFAAFGQQPTPVPRPSPFVRRACPGDPVGNVASVDCRFTNVMRFRSLISGSVSDEALLEAITFGAVDEVRNDPAEWARSWSGYGFRAGSLYAQNLTKGLTEYAFGMAMKSDPRNISYVSDPKSTKPPTTARRIGHAFKDAVTVRESAIAGDGKRLPNIPLFAGATASGMVGDLWYPNSATTRSAIALRAGGSIATAIGASFYTEFSPEIGRVLGAIFKRRPAAAPSPSPVAAPTPGVNQ
jgi:hypothetical protein